MLLITIVFIFNDIFCSNFVQIQLIHQMYGFYKLWFPIRLLIECAQSILNELSMNNPPLAAQSPCIRNCCLDDKDMCLGCFRMLDEILIWSNATAQQQFDIVQSCEARKLSKRQSELP